MKILKAQLKKFTDSLSVYEKKQLEKRLDSLVFEYPFNEYEYVISTLLGLKKIKFDDYLKMRGEYIKRNKFLYVFQNSAPRGFGEQWAQGYLKEIVPDLIKPTKKIDKTYSGEYDFLYQLPNKKIIKIEVKASRAVNSDSREPLYIKALSWGSKEPFDMNFQQIKPKCCDVFVWIGVWRDLIKYWILNSNDIENNKYYSKGQHRGNIGEGQLHLKYDNIKNFSEYEVSQKNILKKIIDAYDRQCLDE